MVSKWRNIGNLKLSHLALFGDMVKTCGYDLWGHTYEVLSIVSRCENRSSRPRRMESYK